LAAEIEALALPLRFSFQRKRLFVDGRGGRLC
jgi:hypothetical protein